MYKKYFSIFIFFLVLLFVKSTYAQIPSSSRLTGEHIQDYHVDITINTDGTVNMQEKIRYDFDTLWRHGIFRSIPYLLEGEEGKQYAVDFGNIQVTDEHGSAYQFETDDNGKEIKFKIGDPDKTITGVHIYTISYTLSGALRYNQPSYDELYLNITGHDWEVPIAHFTTQVTLPPHIEMTEDQVDAICFTGSYGSQHQNCSIKTQGNTYIFSSDSIMQPRENMSIGVKFPKNSVAVLKPREVISFWDTLLGKITFVFIIICIIFWYIILPIGLGIAWFLYGRDPYVGEVVSAWFDPPQTKEKRKLTPAETGTLIDEKVHFRDISGMIIHLAQRGYYNIKEETKKQLFGTKSEFSFIKKKEFANDRTLLDFEKAFLKKVFENKTTVKIKDLELYKTIQRIQTMIYKGLVRDAFFPHNPQSIRTLYTVVLVFAGITLNIPLAISAAIFGMAMPRKMLYGAQQANVAKGLRNFLRSQEKELQFQGEKQLLFEKLLPYAVAFGVEDRWAERFNNINLQKPDWYEGDFSHGFSSTAFVHSLHSSTAQVSSISSPPSSSSSSFSGGFSGGGFGGGGGGSW